MIEFALPWIFLLLPAPLLAWRWLPPAQAVSGAVRVPFFSRLPGAAAAGAPRHLRLAPLAALSVIWLCLLVAAADPQRVGDPVALPSSGRDLMLAVDISDSMQIEDMQLRGELLPRLLAVKAVLAEFIEQRRGDRLGLILFGTRAYVQAPLTFDRKTVAQYLNEAQLGFAGPRTAIGDAIGLAVKRLKERLGERHVLILLSDGANTAGAIEPLAAARLAAEHEVVIYTVGVGAGPMRQAGVMGGFFGNRVVNPAADLDEETLRGIAALTGGRYFRARDPAELATIYGLLDELEPVAAEPETVRPRQALFHWPLALALLLSAGWALRSALQRRPRSAEVA